MPKIMQNIILIIEKPTKKFSTPGKIGHQYMNRIAIDEEAAFEIKTVIDLPFERELVFKSENNVSYRFVTSCN